MLFSKKKLIWWILGLIALLSIYTLGSVYGQKAALRSFVKQYKASEIRVDYGRYIDYRNIAMNIEKKKYDYAKCSADLSASSLYDELTECLSDQECSKLIDKDKEYKVAPELFDKKPLGFKYYADKNGIRTCNETNKRSTQSETGRQ